jgi:hypothetical protein
VGVDKLIIQSHKPLEIGGVYRGMYSPQGAFQPDLPNQRFRVVKESTREEWIECVIGFGESRDWAEVLADLDHYFYEIQTD